MVDALAELSDPAAGVVILLHYLVGAGVLDPDDLGRVGLDAATAADVLAAASEHSTVEELSDDLALLARIRRLDGDIDRVSAAAGVLPGTDAAARLRTVLAEFALVNDVDNVDVAFRLLRLERPELLEGIVAAR